MKILFDKKTEMDAYANFHTYKDSWSFEFVLYWDWRRSSKQLSLSLRPQSTDSTVASGPSGRVIQLESYWWPCSRSPGDILSFSALISALRLGD